MKHAHYFSVAALAAALAATLAAQRPEPPGPPSLPDGAGKAVVQRVCGSTCHGVEIVAGKGYTRDNWAAVVNGMVSRGAKASPDELGEIVEYLAANLPPRTGAAGAGGAGFIGAGPDDAHIVDMAAAELGQHIYVAECVTCHGKLARGGDGPPEQQGPDLVRSKVVLKDRYGSMIGAFLKAGHPTQSSQPSASITGDDLINLAHFLHLKVNETLRSGPYSSPIDVLTGDVKAGKEYFNGAGGCTGCHSATGDLKDIGERYDPVTLQQKFLFPKTLGFRRGSGPVTQPKPVTVDVTAAGKPSPAS
ncbi:MAG: c-type cytochrome [Bryobacterales bacterium]